MAVTNEVENATRTVRGIAESQRKAFEALSDSFVSAGRRNAGFARDWTGLLELQESNARAARDLFTSGMRVAELQQRNVRFVRNWMTGVSFWQEQAEHNARAARVVAESVREQQEGFKKLAEQWANIYEDFFSSWVSYSQEGLKNAQQITEQVAQQATQVGEQVTEQATRATEQVARQGLRIAEEATEQAERTAKQADPNSLPIDNYDELNVSVVTEKLEGLSIGELEKVRNYEKRNKNRAAVVAQIDRKIEAAS